MSQKKRRFIAFSPMKKKPSKRVKTRITEQKIESESESVVESDSEGENNNEDNSDNEENIDV